VIVFVIEVSRFVVEGECNSLLKVMCLPDQGECLCWRRNQGELNC
jgi:hypothetical protein